MPPNANFDPTMKTLAELKRNDCRWIVGDTALPGERPGSGAIYCGAQGLRVIGQQPCPYCEVHAALAYTRSADRQSVINRAKALRKLMGSGGRSRMMAK
jgi:hypothetical protein